MPIEKQKPEIQEKQVDKNRLKLEIGRAGMQHKHPQHVADTLVSAINPQKYQPVKKLL